MFAVKFYDPLIHFDESYIKWIMSRADYLAGQSAVAAWVFPQRDIFALAFSLQKFTCKLLWIKGSENFAAMLNHVSLHCCCCCNLSVFNIFKIESQSQNSSVWSRKAFKSPYKYDKICGRGGIPIFDDAVTKIWQQYVRIGQTRRHPYVFLEQQHIPRRKTSSRFHTRMYWYNNNTPSSQNDHSIFCLITRYIGP